MTALLIRGQWGLGDNIYARPFIRAAAARAAVYLETPWPELYADLPVHFVRAERRLRTQMQNVLRQAPDRWREPPKGAREIRLGYGGGDLVARGIVRTLERSLPLGGAPLVMDLPDLGPRVLQASRRPYAVVRPVTVRTEWRNEARNPDPRYVAQLAEVLAASHNVVAVAHLKAGEEWACEPMPKYERGYLAGELAVTELLALVRDADVIVGGVGWIVPAAIALRKKCFVVLGGHGGHNAPRVITDPRLDLSQLGFAIPERFCTCANMLHRCDKRIQSLPSQWNDWTARVGLSCSSAQRAPAVA